MPTSRPPTSQPPPATNVVPPTAVPTFAEPIQFPSSLTVTAAFKTSPDKTETALTSTDDKPAKSKPNNVTKDLSIPFDKPTGDALNFLANNKDMTVEKQMDQSRIKEPEKANPEEKYVALNNLANITITPVNKCSKPEKAQSKPSGGLNAVQEKPKDSFIRVKSTASLISEANELAKKDKEVRNKIKPSEKNHSIAKEKRVDSPLHIETNFQPKDRHPSPNFKKDEVTHKQIENMRSAEDKIPRPALVPVHLSPTFVKPDKRPPDAKKKKEIVIVSDFDPLGDPLVDVNEPVAIEDSDSDVEVIEDKSTPSEMVKPKSDSNKLPSDCDKPRNEVSHQKKTVPLKDKSVIQCAIPRQDGEKAKEKDRHREKPQERPSEKMEVDETDAAADIDTVMRNLREMQVPALFCL